MITSQHENLTRILQFESQKKAKHFETLTATIDIVSEEDIVETANVASFLRRAPDIEETHQIVIISMDVAENLDRRFESFDQHGLGAKDLSYFVD